MSLAKDFVIGIKQNTRHYHISFEGGGEVPAALKGLFVKKGDAVRAIATHKGTKEVVATAKKAKKDKKEYSEVRAKRVEARKAKKEETE